MVHASGTQYFMMSFRFNKRSPGDFGLTRNSDGKTYSFKGDQSLWIQRDLYDFGWGKEYGFMKIPKLDFCHLWELLNISDMEENRYGAAQVILDDYSDDLLDYLIVLLRDQSFKSGRTFEEACKILKLNETRNRSSTLGKSASQIANDFENWKFVSEEIGRNFDLK